MRLGDGRSSANKALRRRRYASDSRVAGLRFLRPEALLARVQFREGHFYLQDVSTNGVYVNDDMEPLAKRGLEPGYYFHIDHRGMLLVGGGIGYFTAPQDNRRIP